MSPKTCQIGRDMRDDLSGNLPGELSGVSADFGRASSAARIRHYPPPNKETQSCNLQGFGECRSEFLLC